MTQAAQILLDDTESVTALGMFLWAAASSILNGFYIYHWRGTSYRLFIYLAVVAVRLATAVAYFYIVLYNQDANIPLTRPLFFVTIILCDAITIKMDTVEQNSPAALQEQQIKELNHELVNRQQDIENARGTNKALISQLQDMKTDKEEAKVQKAELLATARQQEEALKATRAKLAEMLEKQMELQEELDKRKVRGNGR